MIKTSYDRLLMSSGIGIKGIGKFLWNLRNFLRCRTCIFFAVFVHLEFLTLIDLDFDSITSINITSTINGAGAWKTQFTYAATREQQCTRTTGVTGKSPQTSISNHGQQRTTRYHATKGVTDNSNSHLVIPTSKRTFLNSRYFFFI